MEDTKLQEEIAILTASDAAYEAADANAEEEDLPEELLALEEDAAEISGPEDDGVQAGEELVLEDETDGTEDAGGTEDASAQQKAVVGVRFRTGGKSYYFTVGELPVRRGTHVVVETARGLEYGTSVCDPFIIDRKQFKAPVKRIVRIATEADENRVAENRQKEREAYRLCQEKIRRHGLDMKLIEAEYAFDNSKILFYFTSDGRVDFRDLVKDLAGVFHMRIELRQIGVRDETKILGGYGICGRPLCCHTYLSEFAPVSIRMAKEQNLSLNPAKISGSCGRLMCCLKNEAETYEELNRNLPGLGDEVEGSDGLTGEVAGVDVLRQMVRILVEVDDEKELHEYKAEEITILRRRKRGQAKPKINRSEIRDTTSHGGNGAGHAVGQGRRGGRPATEADRRSAASAAGETPGEARAAAAAEGTEPAEREAESARQEHSGQGRRGVRPRRQNRGGRDAAGGRPSEAGAWENRRQDGAASDSGSRDSRQQEERHREAGTGETPGSRGADGRRSGGSGRSRTSAQSRGRGTENPAVRGVSGGPASAAEYSRPEEGSPDSMQGGSRPRRRSRHRNNNDRRRETQTEQSE